MSFRVQWAEIPAGHDPTGRLDKLQTSRGKRLATELRRDGFELRGTDERGRLVYERTGRRRPIPRPAPCYASPWGAPPKRVKRGGDAETHDAAFAA